MSTLTEARAAYDAAKAAAIEALGLAYGYANLEGNRDRRAELKHNATKTYDAAMDAAAREFEEVTGYAPDSPAIR